MGHAIINQLINLILIILACLAATEIGPAVPLVINTWEARVTELRVSNIMSQPTVFIFFFVTAGIHSYRLT